jgi:AcrR family transcriptional regulator
MTVALPNARRAKKPSENRDKLIAVAHKLMAEHGFAGVSTEEIVRRAGITRGALYYQFVDKQDLFRAVCEALVSRLAVRVWTETMDEVEREEDELRVGCLRLVDCCADAEVRQILLVDGPSVLGFDEWRKLQEPSTVGLLRHALGHLVKAGRLPAEKIEPMAHLLFGALTQAAVAIGSALDPEDARRVYSESLEVLLMNLEAT